MSQPAWLPFTTAPKNRTEVLVYRPDAGVFTAIYQPALAEDGEEDEDNYCWFTPAGEDLTGDLPTHWMPFPEGPDAAVPPTKTQVKLLRDVSRHQAHSGDGLAYGWRGDIGEITVNRCVHRGWLEEVKVPAGSDVQCIAYRLTDCGRAALRALGIPIEGGD